MKHYFHHMSSFLDQSKCFILFLENIKEGYIYGAIMFLILKFYGVT